MNEQKDNTQSASNPFREMKGMIASSIGRIPAALVVIFVIAMTVAALSGLFLKLSSESKSRQKVFMPQRLEASEQTSPVSIKALQGQWVNQTADYAMSFAVIGDRFEWIVKFADIKEAQFYARGNYRIVGNIMVLGQRPDLGKPYNQAQPWLKYLPIAMKDVNIYISANGRNLVWNIPQSEQDNILSHTARIFQENAQGTFEWVKR